MMTFCLRLTRITQYLILITACLGAACTPQAPDLLSSQQTVPQHFWTEHPSWTTEGYAFIRQPHQKNSVRFYWKHSPYTDRFTILSSMGLPLATLEWTETENTYAQLSIGHQHWVGPDPEYLIFKHLGWSIPLAQWIQLIQSPSPPPTFKVTGYARFNGQILPAAYEGTLTEAQVSIRIHRWSFNPSKNPTESNII
ncbi:MAG: hypothetical protein CMF51_03920 [Legionellales bacterium]|nr:hypothetical protein [Legionellales bacterium]|tara:strand:+ start:62 stop:649 length:588 start_codon:yes stop_codon:yes gene_type:complete